MDGAARSLLVRLKAAPLPLRVLCGFGLVLALCAGQSILAYQTASENVAADEAQHRSEQIASLAGESRAAFMQMEAGHRSFLLVGDEHLLVSYRAGAQVFTDNLARLEVLSQDDAGEVAQWQALGQRVIDWQREIVEPGIALRRLMSATRAGGQGLAGLATSQEDIAGIQQILDAAIATEREDLVASHAATVATNSRFMAELLWGTLGVLGVGLAVAILFSRNMARAISQVRAGDQRYREMFEGNGAIQLAIDIETGALVSANSAAADFYGYSIDTLLHMNLSDLTTFAPGKLIRDLQAAGKGERGYIVRRHRLASGETRDIEIHTGIGQSAGRQLIYAIVHDITERKQAEEALQANEERFRKQYKGFPLPTYSWLHVGDDFVMQDFNDAATAIAEGDVSKWIGVRATERFANDPQILADLHACVTEQHSIRREQHFRYPVSGRERDLAFSYVFVPPLTVMLHFEDITEAKRAEQQREALAQSEKLRALGQMASGIAHDLNQSLMLVSSYSDLANQALAQDPPNLSEVQDLLTITTQAAMDGGETVKRLLLFTRAAPEQEGKPVDLASVVRDAAQLTAPRWRDAAQAEGRPISLLIEAEGQPTIQGSPARLRELMTNLIFNAVDAMPAGGLIRLRVAAENGHGVVEVADSGQGMSPEIQKHVFEPFFTTKGDQGSGLGLAMVFGIVEQHSGQIELRSELGSGTTFRLMFPLVDAALMSERAAKPLAQLQPSRPLRVLAEDDEPMMTKAVVRMLKPSGHLVSVAASGEEALEKLAEQTFDVVVSDMGMGAGMNGWELAETVRRRWPAVRFLLATGWGAAVDPDEAQAKGVSAVLAKPYRPVDLLHALANEDLAA